MYASTFSGRAVAVVGAGPSPRPGGLHQTVMRRRRPDTTCQWCTGPRPLLDVLTMKCLPPVMRCRWTKTGQVVQQRMIAHNTALRNGCSTR